MALISDMETRRTPNRPGQRGMTLIEIMVATLILSIVTIGMVEFFAHGRMGLEQEERKRAATLLAQEALERTVAQPYELIDPWTEQRLVGSTTYTVTVAIQQNAPEMDMKAIACAVTWDIDATNERTALLTTFVYEN